MVESVKIQFTNDEKVALFRDFLGPDNKQTVKPEELMMLAVSFHKEEKEASKRILAKAVIGKINQDNPHLLIPEEIFLAPTNKHDGTKNTTASIMPAQMKRQNVSSQSFSINILKFFIGCILLICLILLFSQIVSIGPAKRPAQRRVFKANIRDWKKYNLNGKIRKYKENHFIWKLKFGEKVKHIFNDYEYIFDELGCQTSFKHVTKEQFKNGSEWHAKFDKKGNKIEEIWLDSDRKLSLKVLYKYDEKHNCIEQSYISNKGEKTRYTNRVFANKLKIEENCFWGSIVLIKKGWKFIEKRKFELSSKSKFKYDIHGNLVERFYYDSDGSLGFRAIFKYNSNGQQIERVSFKPDGKVSHETLTEYNEYSQISRLYKKQTKAPQGTIERVMQKGPAQELCVYEYKKYDSYGNWIIRIEHKPLQKMHTIQEREIEYYSETHKFN